MHRFAAHLVLFCISTSPIAAQAPGGETASAPAIGACALLDREVVEQVTGVANKIVLDFPPEEEPAGPSGSACFYADIVLQIDAFTPAFIEQTGASAPEWQPVTGVGDRAFFRDNRGNFAELMGSVGSRTFTIQMDIPSGGTADERKPGVITLAQQIVAQLQ